MNTKALDTILLILVIAGAVNWGLVGFFRFNLVSFLFGAMLFRERNLKSKALDLLLVLIGMLFLYWGSR